MDKKKPYITVERHIPRSGILYVTVGLLELPNLGSWFSNIGNDPTNLSWGDKVKEVTCGIKGDQNLLDHYVKLLPRGTERYYVVFHIRMLRHKKKLYLDFLQRNCVGIRFYTKKEYNMCFGGDDRYKRRKYSDKVVLSDLLYKIPKYMTEYHPIYEYSDLMAAWLLLQAKENYLEK